MIRMSGESEDVKLTSDANQAIRPKMRKSGEVAFDVDNLVVKVGEAPSQTSDFDWSAEDGSFAEISSISWKSTLIFVACFMLVVFAAWRWVDSHPPTDIAAKTVNTPALEDDGEPVFSCPPREVAEAFIKTSDPKERLKWVRNSKEVASRMSSYPAQALTAEVEQLIELGIVNNGETVVAGFGAVFSNGQKRLISVLPTPEGPRVDWDGYARYCSATWPQLLSNEAKSAEVRVYAIPADYYNFGYDENSWDCYALSSPDMESVVYAYAAKNQKTALILSHTLSWGGQPLKMTLQISGTVDGVKHRQFIIDRVLAYSWVRAKRDMQDTWVIPHTDEKNEEVAK